MNESSISGRNKWLYYESGGMILEFPVREEMRNGNLGVGQCGSHDFQGSEQLLRANLRGLHFYKRNEMFFFMLQKIQNQS